MKNRFILTLSKKYTNIKYKCFIAYMFIISRSQNFGNIPKIESLVTFYITVSISRSTMKILKTAISP